MSATRIFPPQGQVESGTVLWDKGGEGYFMTGNHTATLSSPLSACPSGICLIWSYYSGGKTQKYWMHNFFVSKTFIKPYPSGGVCMDLSGGNGAMSCQKYVYIKDNMITGSSGNNVGNAANWVLTHVIAV